MFELCDDSGRELEQFCSASIDSDVETCEASVRSFEHRFSEHAVSLNSVVISALVTLVCPSKPNGLKNNVTRVDVVFFFFSGISSLTILLDA